jgi:hypothetical protein
MAQSKKRGNEMIDLWQAIVVMAKVFPPKMI